MEEESIRKKDINCEKCGEPTDSGRFAGGFEVCERCFEKIKREMKNENNL